MKALRIVLADDHALVRAGIRALLERWPGTEVVGEAANGHEALALVAKQRPDVLLMDVAMQEMSGLEAAQRISEEYPDTKVIILSMHANEEYVLHALQSGAAGYLLKDSAAVELELALDAVARGDTYLGPAISRTVIDRYLGRVSGSGEKAADPLTPRQREILKHLAEGQSVKEIAFELGLSVKTVESHRAAIMERLDIRDTAGLVKYAMRIGLISRV